MDLAAIIEVVVGTPIQAAMTGIAAVTLAAVETRTAVASSGKPLSDIMRAHLRHVFGVVDHDSVAAIWKELAAASSESKGLALLSNFFLVGMPACYSFFHGHVDLLHIPTPFSTSSQGELS